MLRLENVAGLKLSSPLAYLCKFGCSICKELPSLGVDAAKNIHLSQEWQSIIVSVCEIQREAACHYKIKLDNITNLKPIPKLRKSSYKQVRRLLNTVLAPLINQTLVQLKNLFELHIKLLKTGQAFTNLPVDCDIHVLSVVAMGKHYK